MLLCYLKMQGCPQLLTKMNYPGILIASGSSLRDDFSFYPRTWLLPEDQESFEAYAHSVKDRNKKTYIVKPDEGAQGEGIFLIQHPRDLAHLKQPSVVQEYVSKPLLLQGLKFDLRLLCPNCKPRSFASLPQ